MLVGVPKEIKVHESRIAITPEGVSEFIAAGHEVLVESDAGLGSAITNEQFIAVGAKIAVKAADVWSTADLLLKVKEPIESEYALLRKGQILFTYLHLAASKACTDALIASQTTAIACSVATKTQRWSRSFTRGSPWGGPSKSGCHRRWSGWIKCSGHSDWNGRRRYGNRSIN